MNLTNLEIINLSHPVSQSMPHWPGDPQTEIKSVANFSNDGFNLNSLLIGEHSGTHIGAPKHFVDGAPDVASIKPEQLFVKGIKIDVSKQVESNPDFLLRPQDILDWETENGLFIQNNVILIQTNWSQYWSDKESYFGFKNEAMHFPGISEKAVEYLVSKKITGIGIDSPGIDGGIGTEFIANKILAQNGLYHLENLTNLNKLKNRFFILVGALSITGGTGSPCRILAIQEKKQV